ncbi:MAG TPA: YbfB/YjiJ family MFS transporter [Mycobacterium sp.]|nr:YbfB/YjiJ family MFS transporter [Mycobacterium sp.]
MAGLPAPPPGRPSGLAVALARPAGTVGPAAAAMAVGMGVGRFVYTPILPLMTAGAALSPQWGAAIATANYAGYLAGAMAGVAAPALLRSRAVYRSSLIVVVATLALMPVVTSDVRWAAVRFVTGCASALVFMVAASALLTGLRAHGEHLVGHGFGGVGAGIAASGVLVLVLRHATWQDSWWSAAALGAVLTVAAWPLRPSARDEDGTDRGVGPAGRRWFMSLLLAYTLEGVGYIIAGTFLVAAIDQTASTTLGSSAWIIVGVAAVPSAALWAGLSRIWSRPTLLAVALGTQAVGIALPALVGGTTAALASAVLFGATFLGVATVALATGAHLRTPRAVAILTTGYSVGQIAGPVLVTPILHHSYQPALLAGAAIVAVAAVAALVLRHRFPHDLGPVPSRVRAAQ